MKYFNLDLIAMVLLVVGGLNAGISAVFNYDALGNLMSGDVSTVFYTLVGLSAVYAICDRMGWIGAEG